MKKLSVSIHNIDVIKMHVLNFAQPTNFAYLMS